MAQAQLTAVAAEEPPPDGKRRLPVLQGRGAPGEPEEERPPWHWIPLGAAATFLAWLPLATLAESGTRRLLAVEEARGANAAAGVWLLVAHALAFFTAAFLGGLLVGRASTKAGLREATLAGMGAGALAWVLGVSQGTPGGALVWGILLAIMAALGAGAARLGGRAGLRWRGRAARS